MQLVVVVQQRFAKHRLCRRTGVHKSRSGDERGISRGNSQPGGPGLSAEFPRRTLLGSSLNKRRALPHTPLQGVGDALGGHLVNICLLTSAYGGYRRCGRRNTGFRE